MLKLILTCLVFFLPVATTASSQVTHLEHAEVDEFDKGSLRRGAILYAHYCQGCHGLKQIRYSRIAEDLGVSVDEFLADANLSGAKPFDSVLSGLKADDAQNWFGVEVPDLSLVARARGVDWVYTYLKGFYKDSARPFGANNIVYENSLMPPVLWDLQGVQVPSDSVANSHATNSLVIAESGKLSPKEFERSLSDLVTFLGYVSEPSKLQRLPLGKYVVFFLLILLFFAAKLKKHYWREVH